MEEQERFVDVNCSSSIPLDESSIPCERLPLPTTLGASMQKALRSQHQALQSSISSWVRQQEDFLVALLQDQDAPIVFQSNGLALCVAPFEEPKSVTPKSAEGGATCTDALDAPAGAATATALAAPASLDHNGVNLSVTPVEQLEASKPIADYEGLWVDRLGWFNRGDPLYISEQSSKDASPRHRGPGQGMKKGRQVIVRKKDREWALCEPTENHKAQQYEVSLADEGHLIVRSAVSPTVSCSQCVLERVNPSEGIAQSRSTKHSFRFQSNPSETLDTVDTEGSHNMMRSFVANKLSSRYAPDAPGIISGVLRKGESLWSRLDRPPKPRSSCLARIVHSKRFEFLCSLIIITNAITIGWSSNYALKNLDSPRNATLELLEVVWTVFYCTELVLRIAVHRSDYLLSNEWKWNVFDLVLVILAINDQLIGLSYEAEDGGYNLTIVRILRILKMLKLLRMVRLMRIFRQLRLILNSIGGSLHSMVWSFALVGTITACLGICFVQAVTENLQQHPDSVSREEYDEIMEWWGSVPQAMLSMYMSSFGGEDWRKIAAPLQPIGSGLFYGIFLFYIGFFHCVIANTLTSLFVEATITNADSDQQQLILLEMENKEKYIKMLRHWFSTIEKDEHGHVSMVEFSKNMQSKEMYAFASRMGIEITDIRQFFAVLTSHGTHAVDLETFVVGCMKLKGAAKSIDLMDLMHSLKRFHNQNTHFMRYCESELTDIKQYLQTNCSELPPSGAVSPIKRNGAWRETPPLQTPG